MKKSHGVLGLLLVLFLQVGGKRTTPLPAGRQAGCCYCCSRGFLWHLRIQDFSGCSRYGTRNPSCLGDRKNRGAFCAKLGC